jgi:hypothetical protein
MNTGAGLDVIAVAVFPPSTAYLMFKMFHSGQSACNIEARCLMIRQNTAQPKDCIPAFQNFGCKENGWSEVKYICVQM